MDVFARRIWLRCGPSLMGPKSCSLQMVIGNWKAVMEGMESFDDRAFVRIE